MSKDKGAEMLKKADEIEKAGRWLLEGDTVEVVFGEFEEFETEYKDKRTGEPYTVTNFKLTAVSSDGSKSFVLVNKYTFVDVMKLFKEQMKDGVPPKTVQYRRPIRRR